MVVRGADGEDDDHDQQSSTGSQDGYQGLVICWLLSVENTARKCLFHITLPVDVEYVVSV